MSQMRLWNAVCSMEYSSGLTQALIGKIKIIKYFEVWTSIQDAPRNTAVNPMTAIGVHMIKSVTTKADILKAILSSCLRDKDGVVLLTCINKMT